MVYAAKELARELPPRARRILTFASCSAVEPGTTSACAENTRSSPAVLLYSRNYLRVRGEYSLLRRKPTFLMELPPRARRIQPHTNTRSTRLGTTSACAENTIRVLACGWVGWNYLRVRGEYDIIGGVAKIEKELPPRARRIPVHLSNPVAPAGTTSACAENT